MGKTHTQKMQQRDERLKTLPRSERLKQAALIKKKEGRVLDAAEKHALKMTSEYGEIMKYWEQLRTLPNTDERRRGQKATEEGAEGEAEAPVTNSKFKIVKKLFAIIFPKFESMAKTPRVSRVLQSCIKYGSPDQLMKLSVQLSKNFVELCNDAYAHHIVCALFRHAPHQMYRSMLQLVVNNMPSLVTHKFGMLAINAAYTNRLCNTEDRNVIVLAVFKDSVAVMKSWPGYPVLEDILEHESEHQKRLISSLFNLTDKLVSQKEAFELPFVQRLVSAFVKRGTKSEVMELCTTLKPHVVKLAVTREGSALASLTFGLLEPRNRKEVLRDVANNFVNLCCDKASAPFVARIFDLVYDGQILYKFGTAKLIEGLTSIIASPYGHAVILHLLTPDPERKRRALYPSWFEHNLYSLENENWNAHVWLDDHYAKETVEICPKDAQRTHLMCLPPIVAAVVDYITANREHPQFAKHFVARIAKEIVHLVTSDEMYRAGLQLSDESIELLTSVLPNKVRKEIDEDGEDDKEEEAPKKAARKENNKAATPAKAAAATPAKKAASPTPVKKAATATTPKAAATPKAASASATKAEKVQSAKKAAAVTPKSAAKTRPSATPKQVVAATDDDAPVEQSARRSAPVEAAMAKASPASAKKLSKKITPKKKKFSDDE